jgi:hypothetical protein
LPNKKKKAGATTPAAPATNPIEQPGTSPADNYFVGAIENDTFTGGLIVLLIVTLLM